MGTLWLKHIRATPGSWMYPAVREGGDSEGVGVPSGKMWVLWQEKGGEGR